MPASYSAQPTRNILIIGSTGVIGTYITRAIIDARDHFDRICVLTSEKTIVEKPQDIAALDAWGVEIFTGRLEKEAAVKRAYEGMIPIHNDFHSEAGREGQRNLYPLGQLLLFADALDLINCRY